MTSRLSSINISPNSDDSQKAVKEHLLKRQQKIKNHHYNKVIGTSNSRSSLEQVSLDSQLSSPIQTTCPNIDEKHKSLNSNHALEIKING